MLRVKQNWPETCPDSAIGVSKGLLVAKIGWLHCQVLIGELALVVRRAERRKKRLESKQERLGEPGDDERYMEANSGHTHTKKREVSMIYFQLHLCLCGFESRPDVLKRPPPHFNIISAGSL